MAKFKRMVQNPWRRLLALAEQTRIPKLADNLYFGPPSLYAFLSGISLSLGANLLISLAVSVNVERSNSHMKYVIALLFFSSVAFMVLTFPLESARSGWKKEASKSQYLPEYVRRNRWWMYPTLAVALAGLVGGLLILLLETKLWDVS